VTTFTEPVVGGADGQWYEFLDTVARVRVPSSATDGALSITEMHARAGHATPMHRHAEADEAIDVVEGRLTVHTADGTHTVASGESVVLPAGQRHSLVADTQTELVVTATPGGFDGLVVAAGEPVAEASVPSSPPSEAAAGRVDECAPDHGVEILGPPPVSD